MNWWVGSVLDSLGALGLVSWIFWVVFSICLHELGHGFAAIQQGDDTPIRLKRMRLDPLVHMGGMSLIVFACIGFAWGLMPVNPLNFRNYSRGMTLVALAGPAVNLSLAFVCTTAWGLWAVFVGSAPGYAENVTIFLYVGSYLNVLLMMFNLLPVPPLDGATVLGGLSIRARDFYRQPEIQQFAFVALIALMWFAGGSKLLTSASHAVIFTYRDFVVGLLS